MGIFFGVALPARLLRSRVPEDRIYSVATWGVIGGIIGARAFHVADAWDHYSVHPEQIPLIWTGGIAVFGAFIGGTVAGYIAARVREVPIGPAADAAAPGIGVGAVVGRIGDIINGEHWARVCDGIGICVAYTHPDTLGQGPGFAPEDRRWTPGPVHLAIGYEMVWNAIGIAAALVLRRSLGVRAPGVIFWLFALWYGAGRLLFGFLRTDTPYSLAALRQDQLIGVVIMAVALATLAYIAARPRRPEAVAA